MSSSVSSTEPTVTAPSAPSPAANAGSERAEPDKTAAPASPAVSEQVATPAQPAVSEKVATPASEPAAASKGEVDAKQASAPEKASPEPAAASEAAAPTPAATAEQPVGLELVTFDEFLAKIRANKDAKYTLVDVWATWCGPCKENFPHLVEMNKKYGRASMVFASLSFDDPTKPKQVDEAREFLKEKKAVFANYLLNEANDAGFDKLDIGTIPAVFIFTPDGKVLKKFTMDDPNHQFTYADVEKAVVGLLDEKTAAKDSAAAATEK